MKLCHVDAGFLAVTYIKENCIPVGVTIICINAIKSLRKLDIADFLPSLGVHQEAHGLSGSLAVVDIMITIQVQHERSICEHSRDPHLEITQIIR